MAAAARTANCGRAEARQRLRSGRAYLEVAELVLDERQRDEFLSVAAASDSICCARLGRRHRGDDHRGAAELLAVAVPDGKALAARLLRLLDVKGEAHYGVIVVSPRKSRDAVKWARALIERAGEEVER